MSDETPTDKTMACPDCDGMVSKRAASCPHCGAPIGPVETITNPTRDVDPTTSNKDHTKTMIIAGALALLFAGAFLFSSKLEHDASALRSRADDVVATATRMSAADEAIAFLDKAKRLSGAANGIRIGVIIGVLVTGWAMIAKRSKTSA